MKLLGIKDEFIKRYLNEGFSGGEKKRNETKKANRDENLKKIKERDEKRKADKQTKLKELKAGI